MGLENTAESIKIEDLRIKNDDGDLALIVGNEVEGISNDILKMCDVVVHIPMHGRKESLNVSVAAGIGMYEISQKVHKAKSP